MRFRNSPAISSRPLRKEFAKADPFKSGRYLLLRSTRRRHSHGRGPAARRGPSRRHHLGHAGRNVASTTTLLEVVVHPTYFGATSFTADGIIAACKHEHYTDISHLYERASASATTFRR